MKRHNQSKPARNSPSDAPAALPAPSAEGPADHSGLLAALVCAILVLAVAVVFGRAVTFDFVDFDDCIYVYENPELAKGLGPEGVAWAFTAMRCANWHPLTWLSLLLDHQLYGQKPWGYHLGNVVLHAANVVLLFLVLRRMTAELWLSAFVAAVFAVHPLRAESVAWVSERKDVLSGLFFMLTLAAYLGYVRRPFSLARYAAVAALFAVGLLAKPMLVTLPFVLLLLDYWPLRRMALPVGGSWGGSCTAAPAATMPRPPQRTIWQLIVEKLPLLALSAASCAVTARAQRETVAPLDALPPASRIANALVSYVSYVVNFFWPKDLAAFYPYPLSGLPAWKVAGSLLLLAAVTAGVVACWRRWPWLLVGWFWYLGMLVPVIGLMQVGHQAMADRYSYLPQIGLMLALAWGARQALASWPGGGRLCGAAAALLAPVLMACAWHQAFYWHDSLRLWGHAVECMPLNATAHGNLASALSHEKRVDEAIAHFNTALKLDPDMPEVHYNYGLALVNCGRLEEGIAQYRQALDLWPDYSEAHNNLGLALEKSGHGDEALIHYRRAIEIDPAHARAHHNIGMILAGRGQLDEAIAEYKQSAQFNPEDADTYLGLGNALYGSGHIDEAIAAYQQALKIESGNASAHNNLGIALAKRGRIDEAIAEHERAIQLDPDSAGAHNNLAILLVGRGRVDEAIAHYRKALELVPEYAAAHNNLASALVGRGQIDEAIEHFRKALEIKPDYAAARKGLDAALARQEKK